MADRKFEIEVSTSFDPQGAQQANESLQNIGKATQQTSEKAEGLNKNSREMRRLFGEIDRIAPGMGEALKAVFEPQAAGILAIIVAVELLVKVFENLKQQQEAAAQSWAKQHEAAQEAAKSAQEFALAIERAHDSQRELNTAFETQKSVLEARIEGHKKLLDLLEQEQTAEAGDDKQKQDAVKRRFEDLKHEYDLAAELARLREQENITGARRQQQPALDAAADSAQARYQSALKNPAAVALENQLAAGNTHLSAAKRAIKEIDEQTQTLVHNLQFAAASGKMSQEEARAAIEDAKASAENRKNLDPDIQAARNFENAQKTLDAHKAEVDELKHELDEAVKARDANRAAIDSGAADAQKAQAVFEQHKQDAARQAAFSIVDQAGGFANAGNIIGAGVAAESDFVSGHRLTQQQGQEISAMNALFTAVGGNGKLIIQILIHSLAEHKSQAQQIAQLQQQFANLRSIAGRNSTTGQ